MIPDRIPITREGFERLKAELQHMKSVERPKNVRDIEEARAHGDLSENAEYHAAKERQSHISGKLIELESMVGRAEIIDSTKVADKNKVSFGAHVTILDTETNEEVTYQIVGDYEADMQVKRISISSPIARALIGKIKDTVVTLTTPKGKRELEIVEIEYK